MRLNSVNVFGSITLLCLFVSLSLSFDVTLDDTKAGLDRLCLQCPENCTCDGIEASCTDISAIPSCFPGNNVEILAIRNSPRLLYILPEAFQAFKNTLKELRIENTGIAWVHDAAFAGLVNLRVFEMSSASLLLNLYSSEVFSELVSLLTLNLSKNKNLENLHPQLFSKNRLLKTLDLSSCNITQLSEDMFENLDRLTYLSLDSNENLSKIPRYIFENLEFLEEINMHNCGLTVLYPEYFETAYEHASLKLVKAMSNSFYCNTEMCDFVEWMNRNPHFKDISQLGLCKSPSHFQYTAVNELDKQDVCVDLETIILTYIGIIIATTLMLTCCFALAFKNCFVGICRGNRYRIQNRVQSQGRTNAAADVNDDVSAISGNSDLFGRWQMNGSEPPSYDSLAPKPENSSNVLSLDSDDNDSMEGIAPPPYIADYNADSISVFN